jgi:hypothetical protein
MKFFVFVVALLVVQSVWLSFTAIYPLPFDEYTHFGMIQIYANQWLPFITNQPPEAGLYAGDITRYPSYLFSYLLSFPYRLLDIFIDNQIALIISLRLINVVFVCVGLILFRKLLLNWGISKHITHIVLLVFVCTPIVPLLAAHVNYDNLVFMLTPLLLIIGTKIVKESVSLATGLVWFAAIGMIACLVKQAFLPIFIVSMIGVLLHLYRKYGLNATTELAKSFKHEIQKPILIIGLIVLLIIGGLFVERNGGNYIKYGTMNPNCSQVQSISTCENFMPWYRNQQNKLNRSVDKEFGNPLSYTQHWVSKVMRGYFAIFSHTPTQVVSSHEPFGPLSLKALLPLPFVTASALLCIGVVALVSQFSKIWGEMHLRFAFLLCTSYVTVLWMFNYNTYLSLGQAQAIQARYTYPVLILILLLLAKSITYLVKNNKLRAGLLFVVLFGLVWGGGITGYLIRADDTWYWQNKTVITANNAVKTTLKLIVIH